MSRFFDSISKKHLLVLTIVTLSITTLLFVIWILKLNRQIDSQLEKKRFSPPIEFYSAPLKYFKGQKTTHEDIVEALKLNNFQVKKPGQSLLERDYTIWDKDYCSEKLSEQLDALGETSRPHFENLEECFVIKKLTGAFLIALEADGTIMDIYDADDFLPITIMELEPVLFAQFYGKEPILRTMVTIGDTPPICLNALLAIEDSKFLEHQGISVFGIFRAFLRNLSSGRVVQGGSTITQQLVKNYFLTHERTFSRKFKEVFMALLLEMKSSKDDILEAYINEIYMGQNGSFQIRGIGAASEYYFGKSLGDLELSECSLLAAIVNSPGLFNPFRHPESAIERRKKVLSRLVEEEKITPEEMTIAENVPLPQEPEKILSEPAPYFVSAVMQKIEDMGLDTTYGLKIETTMNLKAQEAAQQAVKESVERLEKNNKKVAELKEQGKALEGFLISADPTNGQIQAIVGGRSYRLSQYNRAIQARRQVGSIFKPFVYLAALESVDDSGLPFQPLSLLEDAKFKIKYEGQEWEPKNYDKKYFGEVPMFFALKSSLNAATASLGIKIGLENIIEMARATGIESRLEPYPSLTLGAFELPALEVLQAYSTFARLGEKVPLTLLRKVSTLEDIVLYENAISRNQVVQKDTVSVLVGMMKQTLLNGTGMSAYLNGFTHPAAGKTGTTNDFKDAWFAGFTPLHVAVTWVGYDDNATAGLTGASGAVPMWTQYMKSYASSLPPIDFDWSDKTEPLTVSAEDQMDLNIPNHESRPLDSIQLIFRKPISE